MDEEAQKTFYEGRPSATPSLVLFLLLVVMLVVGACYFTRDLFGGGQSAPRAADVFWLTLFIIVGTCYSVSICLQWRRFRSAPNRKFLRDHPASALEQWTQIVGYVLLCAAFLIPNRLMGGEGKPTTGSLLMAFPIGLAAVACIFGFFHERATRPPKDVS